MITVDFPKVLKSFGLRKVVLEDTAEGYSRRAWFHDLFSMSLAETYKKMYEPMLIQTWSYVNTEASNRRLITLREDKRDLVMVHEDEYTQTSLIKLLAGDFEVASKFIARRGGSIATRFL
jgi:hypothetical protein